MQCCHGQDCCGEEGRRTPHRGEIMVDEDNPAPEELVHRAREVRKELLGLVQRDQPARDEVLL